MKSRSCMLVALAPILFSACYTPRYMYSPAAHNVPVLVKQGDSKLAANYSSDLSGNPFTSTEGSRERKKSEGYDLQGAVAVTNNFAIQANYFNRTERNKGNDGNLDNSVINYRRELTEIGLGYFRSIHSRDKVMFQVFAGAGKGNFKFTDAGNDLNNLPYTRFHQADIIKIYIQPAFIFRVKENFALSVSSRHSFINFSNILTDYSPLELQDYQLEDLEFGYRAFWEPGFTNTIGFNKLPGLKLEYQLSTSLLVSQRNIDYRSFNFSLGLVLDIPKIFSPPSSERKN
jgi:hypothetical protein